jgi:hypothetical protein
MSKERECLKLLRALVSDAGVFETYVAAVTVVDGAVCTVERLVDGKTIENVRLNVHAGKDSGLVITPVVESVVMITSIDGEGWFVSLFSEIEEITVTATGQVKVNAGEIIINEGENGGLVNIETLTQRINRLEDKLKSHQHGYIPYPGGSAGPPVLTTPATDATTPDTTLVFANTKQSDIEDLKVTH